MTVGDPFLYVFLFSSLITISYGYNVLVIGEVGAGKSRLVNAAIQQLGVAAQPAVTGNRLTKRAVTRKVNRYCAEGVQHYTCWYDTPGMDVCGCLTESSQEVIDDQDEPNSCEAITTLDNLVSGKITPGSIKIGNSSKSHSADAILFASHKSGPQSAACGRRILQHLNSLSISIPVVVALTGGHNSVGLSFGDMHVIAVDTSTPSDASSLVTLLSSFRITESCSDADVHQNLLTEIADKEQLLENSKKSLEEEVTIWEQQKQQRQQDYKLISTRNYEIAEQVLLAGCYVVSFAIAIRLVHFLLTTGVVVLNNTQKWSKIAIHRIARMAILFIKQKLRELVIFVKLLVRYFIELGKQFSLKLKNGTLFTFETLKAASKETIRITGSSLVFVLGFFLSCFLFLLRLFPSILNNVNKRILEIKAEREAKRLEQRGIKEAKICGTCMTHLGVEKQSVLLQTDDNEVSVQPEAVEADSTTTTTYPYEMKYRDNTMMGSVEDEIPKSVPDNKSKPTMNESVQVIWTDGQTYSGFVSAILSDNDFGITWNDKSNGSYSVVPLTRIVRFSFLNRISQYLHPLYKWIFRWKVVKVDGNESPVRSSTPPAWDFRKFDSASPGKGRRNSLPVIRNTDVELPDFKKETNERIKEARSGKGKFMDKIGAPSGATFNDVCFAADHLHDSLSKSLAASIERSGQEPETLPSLESISRMVETPLSPVVMKRFSTPPTPAVAEKVVLSPHSESYNSPQRSRFVNNSTSPDVVRGKLLSPTPNFDESRYLQAKRSRQFIPPTRTSRFLPDTPSNRLNESIPVSRKASMCSTVIKSPKMSAYDELTECGDDTFLMKDKSPGGHVDVNKGLQRDNDFARHQQQLQRQQADSLTPIYTSLPVEIKNEPKDGFWGYMKGMFGSKSPERTERVDPVSRTNTKPLPEVASLSNNRPMMTRKESILSNSTTSKADQWERYSSYISGGDHWTQVASPPVKHIDVEPEPGIPHAMSVSSTTSVSESTEDVATQGGVVGWMASLVRPPAHDARAMLRKTHQHILYEAFEKGRSSTADNSIQQLPSVGSNHQRSRSITSELHLPLSSPSMQTTTDLLGETLPDQSWKRFHQSSSMIISPTPALDSRRSSRQDIFSRRALTPEL